MEGLLPTPLAPSMGKATADAATAAAAAPATEAWPAALAGGWPDAVALGAHVGRHALAWYVLSLALAGFAVVLLYRGHRQVQRPDGHWHLWRQRLAQWPWWPKNTGLLVLVATQAGALGLLVVLAHGFAELAEGIGPQGAWGQVDDALTAAVRSHLPTGALLAFAAVSHAGDVLTLVLLGAGVALLLWRHGQRLFAVAWVLGLAGNGLLIRLLKSAFERARPLHEHDLAVVNGFSFPSGHTSGATVAYGLVAYLALRLLPPRWHLPVLLGATTLVLSIGWSRVMLQVHYASDVLAGWASGAAWLTGCILALELALAHRARQAHLRDAMALHP